MLRKEDLIKLISNEWNGTFVSFIEYALENRFLTDFREEIIDPLFPTIHVFEKMTNTRIGKAKYVRDNFGFVDNVFCHNGRVPIEKLDGKWCIVRYSEGVKGLRGEELFSLSDLPKHLEDKLLEVYLSEYNSQEAEREALRAKRKAEEDAIDQQLIAIIDYTPKMELIKQGGNYGSPWVYSINFKTVVDKDIVVKVFKVYGKEEFHENGPAPIQYAYGEIRKYSDTEWRYYEYPEYTD